MKAVGLPDDLVVENPHPDRGMLSSFVRGLDRLPGDVTGAFLCPVDHPCVTAGDLRGLLSCLEPGKIVVPVHGGRRGHPVLFAADLFEEIHAAPASIGARAVVRADPGRVIEVPAGAGILVDVDTPSDHAAAVGRGGEKGGPR